MVFTYFRLKKGMKLKYHLILLIFVNVSSFATDVLIITHAYNQPDFIEMQIKGFKKFLADDYEFVVFNDARNPQIRKQIEIICGNYNIQCIGIPQEIHDRPYLQRWPGENNNYPSVRHSNGIMYSLHKLGFNHDGIVCIIDSDMFLIKPFSITKFLDKFDIAALNQFPGPINYLWPGLAFMNMKTMPNKETINWNCGRVNNTVVDTDGQTYHYLKSNSTLRVKYIDICTHNAQILKEAGFDPTGPIRKLFQNKETWELLLDFHFLHFYAGSRLPNRPNRKMILKQFLDSIY